MRYEQIYKDHPDLNLIEELYDISFPEDERIPFHILKRTLSDERLMYAIYEDTLIGMFFLFIDEDLVYLSYLCVDERRRGKGYGSAILKHITKMYEDKRIVLDIEEVKTDSENYNERKKRKDFYLHNGYQSTGIFYHIYDVDYELLSRGGTVTKEQWHHLIRKHWGPRADTAIYR